MPKGTATHARQSAPSTGPGLAIFVPDGVVSEQTVGSAVADGEVDRVEEKTSILTWPSIEKG